MLTLKNKTSELLAEVVKNSFGEGLLDAGAIFDMLEYPPDKTWATLLFHASVFPRLSAALPFRSQRLWQAE